MASMNLNNMPIIKLISADTPDPAVRLFPGVVELLRFVPPQADFVATPVVPAALATTAAAAAAAAAAPNAQMVSVASSSAPALQAVVSSPLMGNGSAAGALVLSAPAVAAPATQRPARRRVHRHPLEDRKSTSVSDDDRRRLREAFARNDRPTKQQRLDLARRLRLRDNVEHGASIISVHFSEFRRG
ncbi:hypothetical protein HYFRA_00006564 [Hymenoscyphus fraxineus]|uniref:Homeobox domain-containing protein n=1 Tax=Hymenoscyphus fraxineus TaxID=746836 RepID=A0A9N9PS09_9HELO|nr:hypothetical protein HYFRA_00006564 [Hymenoscyphus fraxineus]